MEINPRFLSMLQTYVDHILEQNKEYIVSELSEGLNWDDGWQICASKMAVKATKAATQLSAAAIMSLLLESGNITLNTEALAPDLQLIIGGKRENENESPLRPLDE